MLDNTTVMNASNATSSGSSYSQLPSATTSHPMGGFPPPPSSLTFSTAAAMSGAGFCHGYPPLSAAGFYMLPEMFQRAPLNNPRKDCPSASNGNVVGTSIVPYPPRESATSNVPYHDSNSQFPYSRPLPLSSSDGAAPGTSVSQTEGLNLSCVPKSSDQNFRVSHNENVDFNSPTRSDKSEIQEVNQLASEAFKTNENCDEEVDDKRFVLGTMRASNLSGDLHGASFDSDAAGSAEGDGSITEPSGVEKAVQCSECHLYFKNIHRLKNHLWKHTGQKPYTCEICQQAFTQQSNLKAHQRIHTGERPYTCTTCSATFTQISNLKTHLKIHTGEKPYQCDICEARFLQMSNLKSHKLIHTGERPFRCEECGADFIQSSHLKNHKRIHTDERPFPCETCGFKFRQLSNLKAHIKTHTGEKPYSCEICGVSFAQKSNLKCHRVKLHSSNCETPYSERKKCTDKRYSCEECGSTFALACNLTAHMRVHTGEKPYTCETCGAAFAQKSNLNGHILTHRSDRPFQCPECQSSFKQKNNLKTHIKKKHKIGESSESPISSSYEPMYGIEEPLVQISEVSPPSTISYPHVSSQPILGVPHSSNLPMSSLPQRPTMSHYPPGDKQCSSQPYCRVNFDGTESHAVDSESKNFEDKKYEPPPTFHEMTFRNPFLHSVLGLCDSSRGESSASTQLREATIGCVDGPRDGLQNTHKSSIPNKTDGGLRSHDSAQPTSYHSY